MILPDANLDHSRVYYRVMIDGVLYTSTSYQRHTKTNDHVLCFTEGEETLIGSARKYLSMCSTSCTTCSSPCNHVVIAELFPVHPCPLITDTITGATARHILCVDQSRYTFYIAYAVIPLSMYMTAPQLMYIHMQSCNL